MAGRNLADAIEDGLGGVRIAEADLHRLRTPARRHARGE
jgi:hypothetical protein